ncbi:DUF3987 domain-containing protein [Mangrovimonas aestuarii]|uniref:DUF3987 domain-containing protein n=1 Tax=Mangrovimonas aestuarii TaxID=3018443 RepID=UPI002378FBB0|nr:DUF3987 domain-containing protein [Mangrovimonas aestuarii]
MRFDSIEKIESKLEDLTKSNIDLAKESLAKIIDELPVEFKDLVENTFKYKRVPKEYMLCSILFTVSTSIGLTFYLKALGYTNYANVYFTIIGSRGDAKSEAMKIATCPIKKVDDKFYSDYQEELSLRDADAECKPKRKQVLIQNASIEAAHKVHSDNPNSIGILIDEIYALVEKMGNSSSRDGIAWRNFLLEGYTNGHVDVSRKTTESFRINETYPTLLGGLQNQFVSCLFANGNLESGFIDRLLFTPKLTSNTLLIRGEINEDIILAYNKSIQNILAYKLQSESPEESKKQFEIELSSNAESLIFEYCQDLINRQAKAKPIVKEYMSKMQISIHKFCVLVFMLRHSTNSTFATVLGEEVVTLAIELNEFYYQNFLVVLEEGFKKNIEEEEASIPQVIKLAKKNNASQKSVAEVTGKNKSTISRNWDKV